MAYAPPGAMGISKYVRFSLQWTLFLHSASVFLTQDGIETEYHLFVIFSVLVVV